MTCNVYHATRKSNREIIKEEGLKPICDKSNKIIPSCKNALYFGTNIEQVAELSYENIKTNSELKKDPYDENEVIDFIIYKISLEKVFKNCSTLQEEDSHILAFSGDDTYGNKRDCIIKNKDLKVVYDSTDKWGYSEEQLQEEYKQ